MVYYYVALLPCYIEDVVSTVSQINIECVLIRQLEVNELDDP